MNRTFKTMLQENQALSVRLQNYFKKHGYHILDYTDSPAHQKIGITFEIYDPKRDIFRINVVADHRIHETGNLFIEHKMERSTKTAKGWLHYCLADLICYHDVVSDMGYILDWAKLREDASGFPLTIFRNPVDYDTIGYGYLIPLAEAEKRGYVLYKYNLAGF